MSDIERKGISTSEEATLRCRIVELERDLLFANDALAKGDLARQNAGGMEMQIQELERENAELKGDVFRALKVCDTLRGDVVGLKKEMEADAFKLRLQVVRLREALEGMSELCGNYFDEKGLVCARDKEIWALHLKALSETPAQCAKEALEPTLDLLKEFVWLEDKDSLRIKLKAELQRLERLYK